MSYVTVWNQNKVKKSGVGHQIFNVCLLAQWSVCAGVQVQFLLPSTDTPWQKAEELGWKDRIAMKVDSRNPYQYAPNGLQLTKVKKASLKSVCVGPFERYRHL